MSISNIQNSSNLLIQNTTSVKITKEEKNKLDSSTTNVAEDNSVIYTPSDTLDKTPKNNTYTVNMDAINKIKADVSKKTAALRDMVEKLITKQGYTVDDFLKAIKEGKDAKITVDPETQAKAQADISDDGFWGVKQTSERIVELAKQYAGGDSSRAEAMRDAFKEGYSSAEEAFGGKLPDISKQTYDAVMKGFDDWEGKSESTDTTPVAST